MSDNNFFENNSGFNGYEQYNQPQQPYYNETMPMQQNYPKPMLRGNLYEQQNQTHFGGSERSESFHGAMRQTKFCKYCGEKIDVDAVVCVRCGRQVEELKSSAQPNVFIQNTNTNTGGNVNTGTNMNGNYMPSPLPPPPIHPVVLGGRLKNKWVSLVLCFFLGIFGAHRFYEGKIPTAILYLFTGGLCGIGMIADFVILLFKPAQYYI